MIPKDTIKKYLRNFSESLNLEAPTNLKWQYALVIPAYRESESFFNTLESLPKPSGNLLVILVINKPSWDQKKDSNQELRNLINNLEEPFNKNNNVEIKSLRYGVDVLVIDHEKIFGAHAKCNVGLARKIGFDLALAWYAAGKIESDWLLSTDADAILPPDYFKRIENIKSTCKAICWPFCHMPSNDNSIDTACKMYVLHMHHYALGLTYANSPYNYHSLGSCISVRARAYAEVRGFPKKDAGEDFYMLNKLSKVGNIHCETGQCISLATRESDRVPFGTGPAISAIVNSKVMPMEYKLYHPQCFTALKAVINSIPKLWSDTAHPLRDILEKQKIPKELAIAAEESLIKLGIMKAIAHCREHASSNTTFFNHFLIWFDAFRTLKFIHNLGDDHLPKITLGEYRNYLPSNWPINILQDLSLEDLLSAHRKHFDWKNMDSSHW